MQLNTIWRKKHILIKNTTEILGTANISSAHLMLPGPTFLARYIVCTMVQVCTIMEVINPIGIVLLLRRKTTDDAPHREGPFTCFYIETLGGER